jgi:hypothetical protein
MPHFGMAITTTSRLTITTAERDRVDAEVTGLQASLAAAQASLTSLQTQVATLTASNAALAAQVAALTAELATHPPTPAPTKPGLYVDGGKLRTKSGAEFVVRGMEIMLGQDALNRGFANVIADIKALGCNAISPLFQGTNGSTANVKAFCDAAKSAGMVVGVNADHQPNGRAWLTAPAMVTLLNGYSHVFLECEVETDSVNSDADWVYGANGLVSALRAAGHVHPIKVGAPQGGRRVEYPLRAGAAVLAADPLKNVIFTWQAYWPESTSSGQQWYQQCAGVAAGLAGTKVALGQCAASGLYFLPGLDWRDDIGLTGAVALSAHCDSLGLGYQYWVYSHDGIQDNNVIGHWNLLPANVTANGLAMGAALKVRGAALAVGL